MTWRIRWLEGDPCPARADGGPCSRHYDGEQCGTFVCPACCRRLPMCVGDHDDERCDDCAGANDEDASA